MVDRSIDKLMEESNRLSEEVRVLSEGLVREFEYVGKMIDNFREEYAHKLGYS